MAEWRRSTGGKTIDREGTRSRLMGAMNASAAAEIDRLSDRLNILATVGSVAPFVGLFGTVWGIVRSFTGIASSNNTSLAVVAPGIAEALFATALGLFAAIPAVIAYNRLTHRLNQFESRLGRLADRFHGTLSRELELDIVGGISQPLPIAVPVMPTPQATPTPEGDTASLGRQVAEIVAADLRSSGLFTPVGPGGLPSISFAQVTAPLFAAWRPLNASALVQGFVRAGSDGNLTVGCYRYDVSTGTELTRAGYTVAPANWRRAAHKCADAVYGRLTGEGAYFDTRLVYVAESGPKTKRAKRIAVIDADGSNMRYLTTGRATVLTPRFSPQGGQLVYMTYADKLPRVYVLDVATGSQRPLVAGNSMTFAPRYSPDGRNILFSMASAGNTDIYRVPATGGAPVRLTFAPGIDTGGSYSPDGARIVFESDRGGSQQLYVMGADGSNPRRVSFGGGAYATPVWSPRGDRIAFTKIGGGRFRIGIMNSGGGDEKLLTESWQDEGPSWAPNGRVTLFHRTAQGSGKTDLWSVDLTGVNERRIPTPTDGSDPSWSPLLN